MRPAGTTPIRVLVVDDHEPFRTALRAMLAIDHRFQVVGEAADGEAAVELAGRLDPALVVMDVRLPGINGVEATARIVAQSPEAVVVLVSTLPLSELPVGVDSCGAVAFSPKESVDADLLAGLLAGG
jgi:DNA-binding NarL/FixJ family response regulator